MDGMHGKQANRSSLFIVYLSMSSYGGDRHTLRFFVTTPFQRGIDYSGSNDTAKHLLRQDCEQGELARVQLFLNSNPSDESQA